MSCFTLWATLTGDRHHSSITESHQTQLCALLYVQFASPASFWSVGRNHSTRTKPIQTRDRKSWEPEPGNQTCDGVDR